jgi:hypothetical protein
LALGLFFAVRNYAAGEENENLLLLLLLKTNYYVTLDK